MTQKRERAPLEARKQIGPFDPSVSHSGPSHAYENDSSDEVRPLTRIVIKEEFVVLTGNYVRAILLNQLLYWTERVKDYDKFLKEEQLRAQQHGRKLNVQPQHGWVYKTAEDLAKETLLITEIDENGNPKRISNQTIGRHLDYLVEKGWVERRHNPEYKWDRTWQYRVNIAKLQEDLMKLGYVLDGYPIFARHYAFSTMENGDSIMENQSSTMENQSSVVEEQYQRLHTEITTEITPETTHTHESQAAQKPPVESDRHGAATQRVCVSEREVSEVCLYFQSRLGIQAPIGLATQLKDLIRKHGAEKVRQKIDVLAAQYGRNPEKMTNPLALLKRACEEDWAAPVTIKKAAKNADEDLVPDDRYEEFFRLFPEHPKDGLLRRRAR